MGDMGGDDDIAVRPASRLTVMSHVAEGEVGGEQMIYSAAAKN
jgi:hypothetical protein